MNMSYVIAAMVQIPLKEKKKKKKKIEREKKNPYSGNLSQKASPHEKYAFYKTKFGYSCFNPMVQVDPRCIRWLRSNFKIFYRF